MISAIRGYLEERAFYEIVSTARGSSKAMQAGRETCMLETFDGGLSPAVAS